MRRAGDAESRTVTFHGAGEQLRLDVVVEASDDEGDGEGDDDEDAEGEEDEEGGDAEDQGIYCSCQKLSYGEVRRTLLPDTGRALHCRPVWRAGGEGVLARTPLTEPVCSYR